MIAMASAEHVNYQHALTQTGGAPHLMPVRRAALKRFFARGWPTPRDEAWKYTALDALKKTEWHLPYASPAIGETVRFADMDVPGDLLRFANGRLLLSATQPWAALTHSLAAHVHTAAAQHFGRLALQPHALADINSALWQDGLLLHVPGGSHITRPLFVVHHASEADAMLHIRNLIVLEADAEAVLVERYDGQADATYWNNGVTEIVLGAGARLTHVRLVNESAAATHTSLIAVQQAQDSAYQALALSLGGRLLRHEVRVSLNGNGAACQLDGVFIADGRRHLDHRLLIEHAAPHTTSRQTWRGIAAGRGRGIFDARVVVQPGAQHADAQQASRNLLLSPHAEIDAKPQLEIYADDVQCGHGTTVGQLDETELFYLRSRGIPAADARALLLQGFTDAALGLLSAELRDWLTPTLTAALPAAQERI